MSTNGNCHYFWLPVVSIRFRRVVLPGPSSVLEAMEVWQARSAQRRRLAALDHRMLKDIGISSADAARECRKWFWQG
jgi:uncharacterized protein YjiS (DUF1127 family)